MLLVYTIPEFREDMVRLVRNFPSSQELDEMLTGNVDDLTYLIKSQFKGYVCPWMNEIDRKTMLNLNTEISSVLGDSDNITNVIVGYRPDFHHELIENSDFVEFRENIDNKRTVLTSRETILSLIKQNGDIEDDITIDTAYYDLFKEKFCVVTLPKAMLRLAVDNHNDVRRKIMKKILETNTLEVEDLFSSKVFKDFIEEDVFSF